MQGARINLQPMSNLMLRLICTITNTDDAAKTLVTQSLGHQTSRIGEVEQPSLGAEFVHQSCILFDRRDSSHCHSEPTRTCGFLSQHAVLQRDFLVENPP